MVTPFMADNSDPTRNCESPRAAMATMCKEPIQKTALAKIKKVHCQLGKEGESSFELKGDTLIYIFGLNASNVEDKTKEYLQNTL